MMDCSFCKTYFEPFMVVGPVWRKAMRLNERHLTPCVPCIQHRLGRPLRIEDFDLSIPINQNILLGIRLSRDEQQREYERWYRDQRNEDRRQQRAARKKRAPKKKA